MTVRGRAAAPSDDPADALQEAVTAGLRWLGQREISDAGLRERLARRGFLPDTIEKAVQRLRQSGALDEERAVRAVARTLVLVKRRGRLRARRELEARGFGSDLVDAALDTLITPAAEHEALERALDRRLRGRPLASGDPAAWRRIVSALLRQGFPAGAVRDALRRRTRAGLSPTFDMPEE